MCTDMGACMYMCMSAHTCADISQAGLPFAHLCALMHMRRVQTLVMNTPVCLQCVPVLACCVHIAGDPAPAVGLSSPS